MALEKYRLENLPRSTQAAILAVVALGLAGVFYAFYLKDLISKRDALRTEVERLEVVVAETTAVERQLDQFKKDLAVLDMRLQVLRNILPDQKETPEVLRNVQLMAASSNLKIVRFIPQPVVPRDFYSDWPIKMEVEGSYNALGSFFEKIGRFTRIVNVEDINIKGISGSTDPSLTLNSTCTATTFVFREEQVVVPSN